MSAIDAGGRPGRRSRRPGDAAGRPRPQARPSASARPAPPPARRRDARARVQRTARTRALGRSSVTNGMVVLVIGLVAFAIVGLQVGVLRANMDTADIQTQIRSTQVHTSDVQNDIATQLSDGRIDTAARAVHMVWAPPDAIRSVPGRIKAGKRASTR